MQQPEWIETKKECEVTETGELITKRVTLERADRRLEKKDRIDISLRFLGLAAIFIPLWLFFQQQQSERDKQKALFQLDLYSNTTSELHSMINWPLQSHEFELSKNKILYQLYPKVVLLNDKAVIDSFRVIKDMITYASFVSDIFKQSDTLEKLNSANTAGFKTVMTNIGNFRNSLEHILMLENETAQGKLFAQKYRRNEQKTFNHLNNIYTQLVKLTDPELADSLIGRQAPSMADWLYGSNSEGMFNTAMDSVNVLKSVYPRDFTRYMTYNISALDSIMIKSNALLYKR